MATPSVRCGRNLWLGGGLCATALVLLSAAGVRAQGERAIIGGPTPAAINGRSTRPASSCPLIVGPSNAALQPLRIAPSDVARKNRMGCLSAYDAIYAADGCPLKLCGQGKGIIPLPAGTGQGAPGSPQLPPP
jgi:hypothetical protein